MADGRLWLLRDTYAAETAWAPPYVGKELRLSRLGAFDSALGAIRAAAEAAAARKADDHHRAERQETLAASCRALRDLYQQREHTFAQAMAGRQDWEHATAASGTWPSPPTPNCAAATPARRSSLCSPPKPHQPATPDATASSPRRPPGSAALPPSTRHSAREPASGSAG